MKRKIKKEASLGELSARERRRTDEIIEVKAKLRQILDRDYRWRMKLAASAVGKNGEPPRIRIRSQREIEKILDDFLEGDSPNSIGRRHNMQPATVLELVKLAGVRRPRRPKSADRAHRQVSSKTRQVQVARPTTEHARGKATLIPAPVQESQARAVPLNQSGETTVTIVPQAGDANEAKPGAELIMKIKRALADWYAQWRRICFLFEELRDNPNLHAPHKNFAELCRVEFERERSTAFEYANAARILRLIESSSGMPQST